MIHSIRFKIWLPVVAVLFIVGLFLVLYLPSSQSEVVRENNVDILNELANTMVFGIELSLNNDSFDGLEKTMKYVSSSNRLSYAAILVEDDNGGFSILSKIPAEISDSLILIQSRQSQDLTAKKEFTSESLSGFVVIAFSEKILSDSIKSITYPIYVTILLAILLVSAIYFFLIDRITKPIIEVTQAARTLSSGNYQLKLLPLTSKDEIGALNAALRGLQKSLIEAESKNQKLQSVMREEIERQTQELSVALKDVQKAEAISNAIINTAMDAVVTINEQGEIQNWNKAATKIFGYEESEALGREMSELMLPEELRLVHKKGMEHYLATGEGPILRRQIEVPALCKDGRIIDVELFVSPIELSDQTLFSSFLRDITEDKSIRKEVAEQRQLLNAILNFLPVDIYLKNQEKKFVFINNSLLTKLDMTLDESVGKTNAEIFSGEILETLELEDEETWESGESRIKELIRVSEDRSNQTEEHYLVGRNIVDIDLGEEKGQYLLSFALDITEFKQYEKDLVKALKAKDEFVSTMSHEIRTPLNSIMGLSDILYNENKDPESKEMLSTIFHSSNHLVGLINDILDFSKINAGKVTLARDSLNLDTFLHQIVRQFKGVAEGKSISIGYHIEEEILHYITADELRLSQILNNLFSNGLKFTKKGKVEIVVSTLEENQKSILLRVLVRDTGKGIKAENIDKIHRAFEQEDQTITREYGGTGLGLTIVSSLLELMKTKLNVKSQVGVGSEFSFNIWLEKGELISRNTQDASEEEVIDHQLDMDILYVEDVIPNQFVVKQMVKNWSVNLELASSADEALVKCKQKHFDLILMDIQMPEKDGVDTFHMIRESENHNKNTAIIACTANVESADLEKYKQVGFDGTITKPIPKKRLNQLLKTFK